MSLLRRLFGAGDERVPEWAQFFTAGEYRAFTAAVKDALKRHGVPHRIRWDEGTVTLQRPGEDATHLGLLNIAQGFKQSGSAADVDNHFRIMVSTLTSAEDTFNNLGANFAQARELLKVRLFPDDIPAKIRASLVHRPVAEGVIATLAYDLPDTVASVQSDHVEMWGRPTEELFRMGLENVRREETLAPEPVQLEKVQLQVLSSDSFFTTTRVLFLEEYLPTAPHGALVSIPHRHALFFHPIVDLSAIEAINSLKVITAQMYEEGPGSISPHLYWWRGGEFVHIPAEIGENGINVTPPAQFVNEVLNQLPAPPG